MLPLLICLYILALLQLDPTGDELALRGGGLEDGGEPESQYSSIEGRGTRMLVATTALLSVRPRASGERRGRMMSDGRAMGGE